MNCIEDKISKLFEIYSILPYEDLAEDRILHQSWLSQGHHGLMRYMERERSDLRVVMEGVRSVIVVGKSYSDNVRVEGKALYASGEEDYHVRIKALLHEVLEVVRQQYPEVTARAIVDTAPALEKAWAIKGGLGARGRNSLVVNEKIGSYFNIGMLLLDVKLPSVINPHPSDLCASCKKCLTCCPVGAINSDRSINARKCIAYHTVELSRFEKRKITMKGWNHGCDICQMACPYNL